MAVAGAMGTTMLSGLPAAQAADPPAAAFDYSMPKRFGQDENGDGKIDYFTETSESPVVIGGQQKQIAPASWNVKLDACASTPGSSYAWTVLDHPDPAHPLTVAGGPGCNDFTLTVPEEGTYRVALVATKDGVASAPVVQEVVVQDWLIVSVGDSYGSGEGSPDIPVDNSALANAEAKWDDAGAAWDEVATTRASYGGIQAAIDSWAAHTAELASLDCLEETLRCGELTALIAGDAIWIVAEAVRFGLVAAGEFVEDVIAAIGATIDALIATAEAAVHVAQTVTGALSAGWQSKRCHRSANSGSARAAKKLEDADPHTSVTFLHLSCSGASVVYGLLGLYQGTEDLGVKNPDCPASPTQCVDPQVNVAKQLIGNREVDAVYVSIGGNDAHFADLIIACITQNNCQDPGNWVADTRGNLEAAICGPLAGLSFGLVQQSLCHDLLLNIPDFAVSAAELWEEGKTGDVTPPIDPMFSGHPVLYNQLNQAVVQQPNDTDGWLLPAGRSNRLFLSQYVDAVRHDTGRYCDWATDGLSTIPFFSSTEARWVNETVSPELTANIQAATTTHGWKFVGGIFDGFTNHGYCADDHYMVRLEEAFLTEASYTGMVHPNNKGYTVYGNQIFDAWKSEMYAGGDLSQPRRPDQKPFADAGGPYTLVEGDTVAMTNNSRDGDRDPMTFAWSASPAGRVSFTTPSSPTPTLVGVDEGTGTASVTVSDADGSRSDTAAFTVTNAAPRITSTGLSADPLLINTAIAPRATFTDAGVNDVHTAVWDWGDGTTSPGVVTETNGSGSALGSHTYRATGIYTVKVTVDDGDPGGSTTETFEYVVVYDPEGGFTTGGGWIESPAGAYTPGDSSDPDITGKAQFAFVSKYLKGATAPEGSTSFKFKAGELEFDSSSYQWLVISGTKAQYKGTGRVNGVGGYGFILSAVDGDAANSPTIDKFRIKILTPGGSVLYDNQAGSADDATASTAIAGGQIKVHSGKK
jgi:hypothetical protein